MCGLGLVDRSCVAVVGWCGFGSCLDCVDVGCFARRCYDPVVVAVVALVAVAVFAVAVAVAVVGYLDHCYFLYL